MMMIPIRYGGEQAGSSLSMPSLRPLTDVDDLLQISEPCNIALVS